MCSSFIECRAIAANSLQETIDSSVQYIPAPLARLTLSTVVILSQRPCPTTALTLRSFYQAPFFRDGEKSMSAARLSLPTDVNLSLISMSYCNSSISYPATFSARRFGRRELIPTEPAYAWQITTGYVRIFYVGWQNR